MVMRMPQWQAAKTVFSYVSVGRETDTRELIDAALLQGKRVCVPRCVGKGRMEARLLRAQAELLPAAFGLLEPPASAPLVPAGQIDVLIVACLAADLEGFRLGYGGGYYDRFLAEARGVSICLCRDRALMDSVPRQQGDLPVDYVVTETQIRNVRFKAE